MTLASCAPSQMHTASQFTKHTWNLKGQQGKSLNADSLKFSCQ